MNNTKSMSIDIPENEYEEIKFYADFHGKTISQAFLDAMLDEIELWEDLRDVEARKDEPTSTLAEVRQRLGLA